MPLYDMPQPSAIDFDGYEDDADGDLQRREYQRLCAQIDRQRVLECVLSDLDAEESPLYDLIDTCLGEPFLPGERPRENITVLAKLGQQILERIAQAVQDAVQVRMAVGEVPRD